MSIACAVLAAGSSTRLGTPKQLLCVDGEPLVRRAVQAACDSACERVAVVLGAHADAVSAAVGSSRAATLFNQSFCTGMASSMHEAVRWARLAGAEALLLCVCDQPHLTAAHLDDVLTTYARERRCVASRYTGALGVPALVSAPYFEQLLAIEGDRGAAPLLRSGIELSVVDWPEGAVDLDTAIDVARFSEAARSTAAGRG